MGEAMHQIIVSSAAGLGYGHLRSIDNSGQWSTWGPEFIRDPRAVRRRVSDPYLVVNDPSGVWLINAEERLVEMVRIS